MKNYTAAGSLRSPKINFEFSKGVLEIKGRSTMENALEFYTPLFEVIDTYLSSENWPLTVLDIHLEYFSTTSSICIFIILKKFENARKKENDVIVNWRYESEDEDMLEAGKDFEKMVDLPFRMIPIQTAINK